MHGQQNIKSQLHFTEKPAAQSTITASPLKQRYPCKSSSAINLKDSVVVVVVVFSLG